MLFAYVRFFHGKCTGYSEHCTNPIDPTVLYEQDSWSREDSRPAGISIHLPRAGQDLLAIVVIRWKANFNPPAPCGAGPGQSQRPSGLSDFNPPAPCGAGRQPVPSIDHAVHFNPPAPCGAGLATTEFGQQPSEFQSTCPVRGRTVRRCNGDLRRRFQSTCPVRGRTHRAHPFCVFL